jgi:hypothetical protein
MSQPERTDSGPSTADKMVSAGQKMNAAGNSLMGCGCAIMLGLFLAIVAVLVIIAFAGCLAAH